MLFDLRGRGRRRTVRIIYGGLALLIGAGLVFFGVGAGVGGGGLLNSLTGSEGSSSASFANQIKKYKKLTQQQPSNAHAWEQLTLAQLHEAGGEAYVTSAGTLTSKGRELFSSAAHSWESYLALNPPKPSVELAKLITRVYSLEALNEPSAAVRALQIVVAAEPHSASWYSQLAFYAYRAQNTRIGDLAAAKAVALAPAAQRALVKKELAEVKKNPNGTPGTASTGQAGAAGGSRTITTTTPTSTTGTPSPTKTSAPSATTTTPGK